MLSDTVVLDGSCTLLSRLDGRCALSNQLDGNPFTVLTIHDTEYYTGSYEVIPQADTAVIVECEGLTMVEDLTVQKVPYFQTKNTTGDTVYIASEVI